MSQSEYATVPIGRFCSEIAGIGITKAYELLNAGEIQSISIGKRRLIILSSWHRFVERNLGTPADAPAASPPRPGKGRA